MTQAELVKIYNEHIHVTFGMQIISMALFVVGMFLIYFVGNRWNDNPGSKKLKLATRLIGGLVVLSALFVAYSFYTLFMVGSEKNGLDKDYRMVEEEYILPYFHSLEPVVYHELELTQKIGQTVGRASTTYRYNVIGGKIQGKPESQSKLAAEFDKTFAITELVFEESKKNYSYIEHRQFPFKLDGNYNEKLIQTRAFFTVADMVALIDANKNIWTITMKKDFAEKVEAYQIAQQPN